MSIPARDWAWDQDLPPVTKIVLLALAERADEVGVCWPSLNTIARHCRVSRQTICTHLDKLEAKGLISREKKNREDGSQTSNRYALCLSTILTGPVKGMDDPVNLDDYPVNAALPLEPSVTVTPSSPVLAEPTKTAPPPGGRARRSQKSAVAGLTPEQQVERVLTDAKLRAEIQNKYPQLDMTAEEPRWRSYALEKDKPPGNWPNSWRNWCDIAEEKRQKREGRSRDRAATSAPTGEGPRAPDDKYASFGVRDYNL